MIHKLRYKNITFISGHRVLAHVSDGLIESLRRSDIPPKILSSPSITIFVGIHESLWLYYLLPGIKIGVQTEQLYDDYGQALWGRHNQEITRRIKFASKFMAGIVDWGVGNEKFYRELNIPTSNIQFGPYVFPNLPSEYSPSDRRPLFFGALNERRLKILEKYEVDVISSKPLFGDKLKSHLQQCGQILNIHFQEGCYAEAPRMLDAFLAGKVLISEDLGINFRPGVHFCPLESDHFGWKGEIFAEFSNYASTNFSLCTALQNFLDSPTQLRNSRAG